MSDYERRCEKCGLRTMHATKDCEDVAALRSRAESAEARAAALEKERDEMRQHAANLAAANASLINQRSQGGLYLTEMTVRLERAERDRDSARSALLDCQAELTRLQHSYECVACTANRKALSAMTARVKEFERVLRVIADAKPVYPTLRSIEDAFCGVRRVAMGALSAATQGETQKARLDVDRTATGKTEIVFRGQLDYGREGTAVIPGGNTYIAEDGTRTPLDATQGEGEGEKTSEGRRAPVVTNDEAIGGAQPSRVNAAVEPLTPSSRPGASEEAGISCEKCMRCGWPVYESARDGCTRTSCSLVCMHVGLVDGCENCDIKRRSTGKTPGEGSG